MTDRYFVPFGGANIYDKLTGCGRESNAVAQCIDSDIAHRLTALLNADERLKEQARVKLTAVK